MLEFAAAGAEEVFEEGESDLDWLHRAWQGVALASVCHTIGAGDHMASLDWSQCPEVESIPGKVSGAWVFRGTRVPVSAMFENLKCSSIDEVLENFPVTREQVQAVLDFAAKSAVPPTQPSRAA